MQTEKTLRDDNFISLYRAHVDEVYGFLFMRVGQNRAAAEDITQSVFAEVYEALPRFRGDSSVRTWVFQIARNRLCDYYRRLYHAPFESVSLEDDLSASAGFEEQTLERERVKSCLEALPPQYAAILALKYIDGESVRDIAKMIRKTPKAAESLLQRARAAFIRAYKNSDGGEET